MKTCRILVMGIVQGVGYRYFVQNKALELGVKGWVKNNSDGTVEISAQCDDITLNEFIKNLWKGPMMSRVSNIHTEWTEEGAYSSFKITGW